MYFRACGTPPIHSAQSALVFPDSMGIVAARKCAAAVSEACSKLMQAEAGNLVAE
jgi:hypothetical protein